MRVIFSFALSIFCFGPFPRAFAITDSLIVEGRILNLTSKLYRRAPILSFSRNNILRPQSEITKSASLKADGSFRISIPLFFPSEEIYLNYGGKAETTFLGSKGEIEIVFDADSLESAKHLFHFSGVNAAANNHFYQYKSALNSAIASDSESGEMFYKTFWNKDLADAEKAAFDRSKLRETVFKKNENLISDPILTQWTRTVNHDERLQNLYEYALTNPNIRTVPSKWSGDLSRLANGPLTAQRTSLAERIDDFAEVKKLELSSLYSKQNSLPAKLTAAIIKTQADFLTNEEITALDKIIKSGITDRKELGVLNSLYNKNNSKLDLIFSYEVDSRTNYALFDSVAADFLSARYLPKNFFKYTIDQQIQLYNYIKTRIRTSTFRKSLDEIVQLEVKDSTTIDKLITSDSLASIPIEILPEYWFAESKENGEKWIMHVIETFKGKIFYLLAWNVNDKKSRTELEFASSLRDQLPADVEFIYLHVPGKLPVSDTLVRQFIGRQKLKGVHLFLNSSQTSELPGKLNALKENTYAVIRPNGKMSDSKIPLPSQAQEVIKVILDTKSSE